MRAASIEIKGASIVFDRRDHPIAFVELADATVTLEKDQPADTALRTFRIGGLSAIVDCAPFDHAVGRIEDLSGQAEDRIADRIAVNVVDYAIAQIKMRKRVRPHR